MRAPNGINRQVGRFILLTDHARIGEFGDLDPEAWWAKRRDEGHTWKTRDEIPAHVKIHRSAAALADHIRDVPCIVFEHIASTTCRCRGEAGPLFAGSGREVSEQAAGPVAQLDEALQRAIDLGRGSER